MKTPYLLPHRFKTAGWLLFILAAVAGIAVLQGWEASWLNCRVFAVFTDVNLTEAGYFTMTNDNITNEITGIAYIVGALLVGFSREKEEDEYIGAMRLKALLWATLINYILVILALLLVYGLPFLTIMVINMFTTITLFVLAFNLMLFRYYKSAGHEK